MTGSEGGQDAALVEDVTPLDPELQARVDAAALDVEARCAADPDLVHGDVVEQVASELPLDVAVELCLQAMDGFVPDTVRERVFEAENSEAFARSAAASAERDAVESKARQRSQKAAATRARTLAAEAAVEKDKLRSATCPSCFQVRSPSGVCGCD